MSDKRVTVVGCGIFGAEVALAAAQQGFEVTVYEATTQVLSGASRNNQNRLHLGFHYPRDLATGLQSIRGFQRFIDRYPECIAGGFPNAYFIADEGSLTSPAEYLAFCDRLGAPYTPIQASDFPLDVRNASTGILCDEVVYDVERLRAAVLHRLQSAQIQLRLGTGVQRLVPEGGGYQVQLAGGAVQPADAVINCTYADINRLTAQLGHPVHAREYEYTVVPVISLEAPRVGVTVMDGPFMTVLPFGQSRDFLLYNVEHTVVAREVGTQLDPLWLTPEPPPFAMLDREAFFRRMVADCARFLPALEGASLRGFLHGPRMVLARNHATDARPSLIQGYGNGYYTVFSGKIDHCVWVAEDLVAQLCQELGAHA